MKVYRIAKKQYLKDLSGEGARLFGGRWNKRGHHMLYTSESLAISVLELLVHLDYSDVNKDFGFIELDIPDHIKIDLIKPAILKQNWRANPPLSFTQDYGSQWLVSQKTLALKVPSAVLPTSFNYLINPKHQDFGELKIIKVGDLDLDSRLM
ncbi:MAG: RES family NAD+ phosphorylase [Flavobacteriaceae bacterium]|nr:RES family NAD+ phosphorylase [Flavobacteriaceae bacterium]